VAEMGKLFVGVVDDVDYGDNGDAAINRTAAIGVWLVAGLGARKKGKHKRRGNDVIATAGWLLLFGL
jgi:hypothetical protein